MCWMCGEFSFCDICTISSRGWTSRSSFWITSYLHGRGKLSLNCLLLILRVSLLTWDICYFFSLNFQVIHQWPTLKYPEMAILKLVGITAVFFLAGLLPWVDNYAHLFGFIFGFLLSYALLPFVTFGVYDRRRKTILVWICLASVVFLFVGLLLLFYVTPIHDCEVCKYFNCIPITKDFCADQNINLRADI